MKNLLLFLAFWGCTAAMAVTPLKRPLQFVRADSVLMPSSDVHNATLMALKADPTLLPIPTTPPRLSSKAFKAAAEKWEQGIGRRISLTGGLDEEGGIDEAITAAQVLYESAKMLLLTADARYAEAMERAYCNALPAAAGGAATGGNPLMRQVAAAALLNAVGMIYATDSEGVFVNFYANCTTRIGPGLQTFTIDMVTAMPDKGRVRLRIGGIRERQREFTLRVRIPEWACPENLSGKHFSLHGAEGKTVAPTIFVNGREEDLPVVDGYAVIRRKWNNGDEVYFDLPLQPVCVRRADDSGSVRGEVAVMRGPVVYVPAQETSGCYLSTNDLPVDDDDVLSDLGCPVLKANFYKYDTPADAKAESTAIKMVPYTEKGGQVWLSEPK